MFIIRNKLFWPIRTNWDSYSSSNNDHNTNLFRSKWTKLKYDNEKESILLDLIDSISNKDQQKQLIEKVIEVCKQKNH